MIGLGFFGQPSGATHIVDTFASAVSADSGTTNTTLGKSVYDALPSLCRTDGDLFFLPGFWKTSVLYAMKADGSIVSIPFTRATTATYFNSSGKITSAASNEPRFDYDPNSLSFLGYLSEPQRTNLCTRSNEFNNTSTFTNTGTLSITSGQTNPLTVAGNDMWLLSRAGGTAQSLSYTYSSTASVGHTTSIFVKAGGTGGKFGIKVKGGSTRVADFVVNLSTGAVDLASTGGTYSLPTTDIRDCGNGVWRIQVTVKQGTAESTTLRFGPTTLTTSVWEGTGSGAANCYVYGIQTEVGGCATSYIPTTGATATRNNDQAILTSINASPHDTWFSTSEGTVYCETALPSIASLQAGGDSTLSNAPWEYRAGTSSADRIYNYYPYSDALYGVISRSSAETLLSYTTTLPAKRTHYKIAQGFKETSPDMGLSLNGRTVATNTIAMPATTLSTFSLGCFYTATTVAGGYIKSLVHFNTRRTDAELVTLST